MYLFLNLMVIGPPNRSTVSVTFSKNNDLSGTTMSESKSLLTITALKPLGIIVDISLYC